MISFNRSMRLCDLKWKFKNLILNFYLRLNGSKYRQKAKNYHIQGQMGSIEILLLVAFYISGLENKNKY